MLILWVAWMGGMRKTYINGLERCTSRSKMQVPSIAKLYGESDEFAGDMKDEIDCYDSDLYQEF